MQLFTQPQTNNQITIIPQDVPVYRVRAEKFYADDRLFEPGKIIVWHEQPSKALEPLNEKATEAMTSYLKKLDDSARAVAEKNGKGYVSELETFMNSMNLAKEEGRRVSVLNEPQAVPLMGGKQKRPSKANEIEIKAVPVEPELVKAGPGPGAVNKISETGLG